MVAEEPSGQCMGWLRWRAFGKDRPVLVVINSKSKQENMRSTGNELEKSEGVEGWAMVGVVTWS
jgi:hypothetical protein